MLTQNDLRVAIIMCKRASCSGEEASAVAGTIIKLETLFNQLERAVQVAKPEEERKEPKQNKGK